MAFVTFTRPDQSSVSINSHEVTTITPVPTSGALKGPLDEGTRITFRNHAHQDVIELLDEVTGRLNAAEAAGA